MCFLFSRCVIVPLSATTVHMRKLIKVNESPAMRERVRGSEAVLSEILTVPME